MPCLALNPSAPDQLNQLGDLSSFFKSLTSGVSSVSTALANNSGAIVNVLDAYGKMQVNKAAGQVMISDAALRARLSADAGRSLSPDQAQAYLAAQGQAFPTPSPMPPFLTGNAMPSWVLPVGLGVGALVLLMVMMPRRGNG
ncbi:MAG TPA: hypothetical protein VF768_11750 [Holophagaceae bacterium]